jgi:hypothetical protein
MKTKDFVSLAQQLLRRLPGFTVKGPMMFICPAKHYLRGIYFEASSFDAKPFYVWTFILPLYVPNKYVSFNLGKRVRNAGGDRWKADAPNLIERWNAMRCRFYLGLNRCGT